MGWAVGGPDEHGRFIGYGVPATCDHPGCGADIDRGLECACGGGVTGDNNCGLFFCGNHLSYAYTDDEQSKFDDDEARCERCNADLPPFDPTPDTREWIDHLLTDESWQQWRDENPARVAAWSA